MMANYVEYSFINILLMNAITESLNLLIFLFNIALSHKCNINADL